MKTIIVVLFALLIVKGAWASPFSENVLSSKSTPPRTLKELEKVLFPTRLDGVSGNMSFRIVPKKLTAKDSFDLFDSSQDFLSSALAVPAHKNDFLSQSAQTRLPYNLFLQAHYDVTDAAGPAPLQSLNEYAILKTSSFGIAYPLTSRLTLDGRYAVVKSDNIESISPFLRGTYRLNAATSISVSYPDLHPEEANTVMSSAQKQSHTSAELKIHF